MKLYNTAARKIESFVPQNKAQVKIYSCGPTVYSRAHIGNFTAYVYWDLLVRVLRLNGWQEKRVMNITDVGHLASDADTGEDKMEKGAKREGKSVWQIAEKYTAYFLQHFQALKLIMPTEIVRATDMIEADKALVDVLDQKGYVYETSDGLYFDTAKFKDYAKFAKLNLAQLKAGARVEFSAEKRNVSDFALWKWVREGEDHAMQWQYRGRAGYPGWHIECATIVHEKLGEPIDIHTGGVDHIPIHHTNEIAELTGAYGKTLALVWLHNNFITVEGAKIAKSKGNGYTFEDLAARGFTHLDYKLWVLQGHFRAERNFSFADLKAAAKRRLNYRNFAALRYQKSAEGVKNKESLAQVKTEMLAQLNNNLNSAGALAILDEALAKVVPNTEFIQFLDVALGLDLLNSTPEITPDLNRKIKEREEAKRAKDYGKADALRGAIEAAGYELNDQAEGSLWRYKV